MLDLGYYEYSKRVSPRTKEHKMLVAKRHFATAALIVVTDTELDDTTGTVVARYNETHDVLTLTKNGKGRKAEIQVAIAKLQS